MSDPLSQFAIMFGLAGGAMMALGFFIDHLRRKNQPLAEAEREARRRAGS